MDNTLKRFIDRADFITDFKQQCNDLQNEPDKIKVISYYGYGGLGKTALLQHLMEPQNKINGFDYIYHDFDSIVDMRGVLKKLKRHLSKIGCEFPLFEMGNYLYEISIGENSLPPQNKSFLSDYPFISNVLNLSLATFTMASSGGVAAAFAAADVAQKVQPVMEEIFNTVLKKLNIPTSNSSQMAHRIKVRKYIEELKKQGENRPENQLENDLPKLFAQDFSYWTANQNRKVVIFLDSYDILKNKGRKTKEHPEPDWWIKGEDEFALGGAIQGLLLSIPNVVWVLSGRNELKFEGYLGEKIHQKELKPLNNIYSLQFLQSRGITNNDELCAKITKLTQGYPLYLELCGQQYRMLKKKDKYHEPEISDFGPENEEFTSRVGKIVLNLIECMDDTGIKEMIKYLCILRSWTDDMASEIIPTFNETAYNMIKNFSFVRSMIVEYNGEDYSEEFFKFDDIVQDILIEKYKKENKIVIKKTKKNTSIYFKNFLKDSNSKASLIEDGVYSPINDSDTNYINIWSDLIIRLADSVEELKEQYDDNFASYIENMHNSNFLSGFRQVMIAEEILNKFLVKAKTYNEGKTLQCIFFERKLSDIKEAQSEDDVALEYKKSIYLKLKDLFGLEHPDTIEAMNELSKFLGHLSYREKIINQLNCGIESNDNVLKIMKAAVASLWRINYFKQRIPIFKQMAALYLNEYGEDSPQFVGALEDEYTALSYLNGQEDEKLRLKEQIIEIESRRLDECIKEIGENGKETIEVMELLKDDFKDVERKDDASKMQKRISLAYKHRLQQYHSELREYINKKDIDRIFDVIKSISEILDKLNLEYKEISEIDEIIDILREIAINETDEINKISAYYDFLLALLKSQKSKHKKEADAIKKHILSMIENRYNRLANSLKYGDNEVIDTIYMYRMAAYRFGCLGAPECVQFQRQLLEIYQKTLPEDDPKIMNEILCLQTITNDSDEKFYLLDKAYKLSSKYIGSKHIGTIGILRELIKKLDIEDRYSETIFLRQDMIKYLKDNINDTIGNDNIIKNHWYKCLDILIEPGGFEKEVIGNKKYGKDVLPKEMVNDILDIYEQVWHKNSEIFGKKSPNTISAMELFAEALEKFGHTEKALDIRTQMLELQFDREPIGNKLEMVLKRFTSIDWSSKFHIQITTNEVKTLTTGQSIDLTYEGFGKIYPMKQIKIKFDWDTFNNNDVEIDIAVLLLDASGKVPTKYEFLNYKPYDTKLRKIINYEFAIFDRVLSPRKHRSGAICDNIKESNYKDISIDFGQMMDNIEKVVFVLTIKASDKSKKNFGSVKNIVLNMVHNKTFATCLLDKEIKEPKSIIVGELQRDSNKNQWKFKYIGEFFEGELENSGWELWTKS